MDRQMKDMTLCRSHIVRARTSGIPIICAKESHVNHVGDKNCGNCFRDLFRVLHVRNDNLFIICKGNAGRGQRAERVKICKDI